MHTSSNTETGLHHSLVVILPVLKDKERAQQTSATKFLMKKESCVQATLKPPKTHRNNHSRTQFTNAPDSVHSVHATLK